MLQLFPERRDTSPEVFASGLRLGGRAPAGRPYLALNMVSTLDGKATIEWRTRGLSTDLDRRLFHQLRTQVDAVMVGAGTARVERYGRIVKTDELRERRVSEGLAPDALAVIVSARLDLPADLPLFHEPEQEVVIATGSDAVLQGTAARIEYLRTGDDLPLLMARLRHDRSVRSILCEGGPTLNSHLLAAGLVDELFLTLNAKLTGGAAALTIVAGRDLVEPAELELVSVAEGGADLFTRWRIAAHTGTP
ncbi:MAG TPA: dihydrofolate reductase family protein [Thermoleophilaceae bacterium]|nr:dihydrofolate reductase family protein [Thermoleophilaceae bacterium]